MADTELHVDMDTISRILGAPVLSIEPLIVVKGGSHSSIFTIRSKGSDYILRIPKGQQGWQTKYVQHKIPLSNWSDQQWATDAAREAGIPAPEIVYSNRFASESERFVIMTRLPGEHTFDYEEWNGGCPYDEREFGTILSKLHTVTPSGYGPIDDFGNTYFTTWAEFLTAAAEKMLEGCAKWNSLDTEVRRALAAKWLPALSKLHMERRALLHLESLGYANILFDPGSRRITGFLDFEDCIGGDPLFELDYMCHYYGPRGTPQPYFDYGRFEETYGIWPENPHRSVLYRVFRYMYPLAGGQLNSKMAIARNQEIAAYIDQL